MSLLLQLAWLLPANARENLEQCAAAMPRRRPCARRGSADVAGRCLAALHFHAGAAEADALLGDARLCTPAVVAARAAAADLP